MVNSITPLLVIALCIFTRVAKASQDTIGPHGINSVGLKAFNGQPLDGSGENIGEIDITRPGRPPADDAAHSNTTILPYAVFLHNVNAAPPPNMNIDNHAEIVAGVMISTDTVRTGVATGARLFATAEVGDVDPESQSAQAGQFIATQSSPDVHFITAINISYLVDPGGGATRNGNDLFTEFVDWSAADHNVLYVTVLPDAGQPAGITDPSDNFNGITVASLAKDNGGTYSLVSSGTYYSQNSYSIFNRTFVSLLAPGDDIEVPLLSNGVGIASGTSVAAPHVTATVALLRQYGRERFSAGDPKITLDYNRHEVMKAVLLNSANKIKDDGTRTVNGIPVPVGGFLGMDRTVLDKTVDPMQYPNGKDWLQSEAYLDTLDGLTPLDPHMGAGALDAKRALKQFSAGSYDSSSGTASIGAIGWDYQSAPGLGQSRKYVFSQQLVGGSFISITLAYDRKVTFDSDGGRLGQYDVGDTFNPSTSFVPGQDQKNDLDLYLLPLGATNLDNPIAFSDSSDSTIEHIFAQIPMASRYEIWVYQYDNNLGAGSAEQYALAWWADPVIGTAQGDYNGDGVVDAQDYTEWRTHYGGTVSTGTGADGNGDSVINSADYVIWRKNRNAGSGLASVPEPMSFYLVFAAIALAALPPPRATHGRARNVRAARSR